MFARIVGSLVAIGTYQLILILLLPQLLLSSGQVAGGQFENSDSTFVHTSIRLGLNTRFGVLPAVILLVVLLAIWWRPIRQRFGGRTMVGMLILTLGIAPAQAYYDKTDYTEA